MIGQRLGQFFRRHGRAAPRMAALALMRTAYQRESVRRCLRPFVQPRRPAKWLFLVGCYNSGTTIAQAILAAHPDIATLPWEGSLITSVLPNPEEQGWTRMWLPCQDYLRMPPGHRPDLAERIVRDWSPWWNKPATVFLEKSITNVTRMAWLDRHFENAYFVGIVRNGYCAAEGICRKTALRPRNAQRWGATYPIEMAGRQWVAANECLLDGSRQVQRYYQFAYENLLSDPVSIVSEICHFIDVPVPSMSYASGSLQVDGVAIALRTDTNAASFARLSASDLERLDAAIGPMQRRLGYDRVTCKSRSGDGEITVS